MPKVYAFTEFGDRENELFVDLPKPEPDAGQLLVRVRAAGVNPKDWKERAGFYKSSDLPSGLTPMGSEVAGVVEQVGGEVHGFSIGDEVFGTIVANGAFSEYSLLDENETAHKPKTVSFLQAATLPIAAATAYAGLHDLHLGSGETLLIIGVGGGVGIPAAQFAIAEGLGVIGTASAGKKDLVESFGVTHVTYGNDTADRVRAVAAPAGVDAIFDMVGGDAMRELGPLVTYGRVVTAASAAAAAEFGGKKISRIRGTSVLDAIANMITAGTFTPLISEVFPLKRVGDALAVLESGHVSGKVVVEVA